MTISFGLSVIRILTQRYIPDKSEQVSNWYKKEIYAAYMNIQHINIVGV